MQSDCFDNKRREFIADCTRFAGLAMMTAALPLFAKDSKTTKAQSKGGKNGISNA